MEESARAWCDNVAPMFAVFGEGAVERAGVRPGARVLDLWCGPGIITAACALRAGLRGLAVGVDVSPAFLREAQKTASRSGTGPRPRFVRSGPRGVPLADGSVDAVVSAFGMPMTDGPYEFEQAFRLLRPGGMLSVVHLGPGHIEPMAVVEKLIHRFRTSRPSPMLEQFRGVAAAHEKNARAQRAPGALQAAARAAGFESVSVTPARVRQRLWGTTNFLDVCLSFPSNHLEYAEMEADAKELFVTVGQEELSPFMDLEEFIATADLVYLTATRPEPRR